MNFKYKRTTLRILLLLPVVVLATSVISLIPIYDMTAEGAVRTISRQSSNDDESKIKFRSYKYGDKVKVVGEVTGLQSNNGISSSDRQVLLKIFTPSGRLYDTSTAYVQSDGHFVGYLDRGHRDGIYHIEASFKYHKKTTMKPSAVIEKVHPQKFTKPNRLHTIPIKHTQVEQPVLMEAPKLGVSQNSTQPPLVSQPEQPPEVNVRTYKETYQIGDKVKVVGEVTRLQSNNGISSSDREVSLGISDPNGNIYNSINVPLDPDGHFIGYLDTDHGQGVHKIKASLLGGNASYDEDEISFSVTEKPMPIELMIIPAICGPAGLAAYKVLKPKSKPELKADIFRLNPECGIEEANHSKVNEFGSLGYTCDARKIEEEFTSIWSIIQESRQKAKQLQNVKEFSKWCKEAKEDPNLIIARVSDELASKLLSCVRPFFTNLVLNDICLKSQYNILNKNNNSFQQSEVINSHVQHKLQFAIKPIHPYIEIALLVNEIKKSAVKVVFKVETSVCINKIEISSAPTGIKINTQELNVSVAFSISKLCISHFSKPIDLAIFLGKREFLINELNLVKYMELTNMGSVGIFRNLGCR